VAAGQALTACNGDEGGVPSEIGTKIRIPGLIDPFLQIRPEDGGATWTPAHRFNLMGNRTIPFTTYAKIVLALLCRRLAWQIAITIPGCAAAMNLVGLVERAGIGNAWLGWSFVVATTLAISYLVIRWQKEGKLGVARLFLLLMWTTVGISFLKTPVVSKSILFPSAEVIAAAGGKFWHLWDVLRAQLMVRLAFTLMAVS
jgi:hypothetical protein